MSLEGLLLVDRLAVFHGAATLALAGVLAGAAVVAALATAFALAGVLACAVVSLTFFLLVGEDAGVGGGALEMRRLGIDDRLRLRGKAAGDDARERSAGEQGLGLVHGVRWVCVLFF